MTISPVSLPTDDLDPLIPHRPPMQLLDAVLGCDNKQLLARARLRQVSSFTGALGVPACIGLEYMGQAAAAYFSVAERQIDAPTQVAAPRPGMLIASRSYSCARGFFPVPADLLVSIELTSDFSGAQSGLVKFSGNIRVLPAGTLDGLSSAPQPAEMADSTVFAQGDLSVYLPPA